MTTKRLQSAAKRLDTWADRDESEGYFDVGITRATAALLRATAEKHSSPVHYENCNCGTVKDAVVVDPVCATAFVLADAVLESE